MKETQARKDTFKRFSNFTSENSYSNIYLFRYRITDWELVNDKE